MAAGALSKRACMRVVARRIASSHALASRASPALRTASTQASLLYTAAKSLLR